MSTPRNTHASIHNDTNVIMITPHLEEARLMAVGLARSEQPVQRHGEILTYVSNLWARFVPIIGSPDCLRGSGAMVVFGPTPLLHVSHDEFRKWQETAFWANERLRRRGVDPN